MSAFTSYVNGVKKFWKLEYMMELLKSYNCGLLLKTVHCSDYVGIQESQGPASFISSIGIFFCIKNGLYITEIRFCLVVCCHGDRMEVILRIRIPWCPNRIQSMTLMKVRWVFAEIFWIKVGNLICKIANTLQKHAHLSIISSGTLYFCVSFFVLFLSNRPVFEIVNSWDWTK